MCGSFRLLNGWSFVSVERPTSNIERPTPKGLNGHQT
jgi:hypothetical protein